MKDYEIIFEQYLKEKNLKLTRTRKIILNAAFSLHEHFDVDILYETIKHTNKNVSRATIYRTIPLLIESGLVKSAVRTFSKENYEHVFGHPKHLHLICEKCGKVIEEDVNLFNHPISHISDKNNFMIKDFSISIKGVCAKCITKQKN